MNFTDYDLSPKHPAVDSLDLIAGDMQRIRQQLTESDAIACEGLNSTGFGRSLVGITDGFLRLANVLKTGLFKSFKDLKRSELREYVEANMWRVRVVEGLGYDKLVRTNVVTPDGLVVPVALAAKHTNMAFKALDVDRILTIGNTTVTNIMKGLSRGQDVTNEAAGLLRLIDSNDRAVQDAMSACNSDFRGGLTQIKVNISTAYPRMQEVKEAREVLLTSEIYLQQAMHIEVTMRTMASTFDGITQFIKADNVVVSKTLVDNLARVAEEFAYMLTAYATVAQRQMALEHNHVLSLNIMYNEGR